MNERHIEILKEIIVDFNEYSTDYTKTRCREIEQVLIDTVEEIEKLQTTVNDCKQELENFRKLKEKYQLKKEIYKSRNEKAIEYCENNKEYTPRLIDVINILKGSDEK